MLAGMIWRVLCLLLLALPASVNAALRHPLAEPRFQAIGDTTSISDGVVTALAQDEAGMIWIGTTVGLVRYDGYRLKPFTVGEGSGQLSGTSFVRSVLAAPDRKLWVGLEKDGLAVLDTARNAWTVYRADPANPRAVSPGSVRAMVRDLDGHFWVGTTGGGLDRLDPDQAGFTHHRRASGHLPDDRVAALLVDRRGDLWVGTWNGLVRRQRGADRFEPVTSAAAGALDLKGRVISMINEAPDGRIWIGTRQGDLLRIDPATGQADWLTGATDVASGPGQHRADHGRVRRQ